MNGIFAYVGKGECRDLLLSGIRGMKNKGRELSGIAVLGADGFAQMRIKGSPAELYEKGASLEYGATLGLCECADSVRTRPAAVTAPPAVNDAFAVALDHCIENFDALRQWCRVASPVAGDEDLLLAMLSGARGANEPMLRALLRLVPSLQASLGFALVSAADRAIYARAGTAPFFIGVREDGFLLANEAETALAVCSKYFLIENGELVRMTRDKVTVYDRRGRKIKKPYARSPLFGTPSPSMTDGRGLPFLSHAAKDTLSRIVKNNTVEFEGVRLSRRLWERVRRVVLTGSGRSSRTAALAARYLEAMADVPCSAYPAGEVSGAGVYFDAGTLLIAISPDGEDEAVLQCILTAKEFGARVLLFTARPFSLAAVKADMVFDRRGFDSGEGSFISEALALSLFAIWTGYKAGIVSELYISVAARLADMLPGKLALAVKSTPEAEAAATRLLTFDTLYITGEGADSIAAEEAAYHWRTVLGRHAIALPLSELAEESVDGGRTAVLAVASHRESLTELLCTLRRMKARGACVMAVTTVNLESEMTELDRVLSVTESLPLFDTLTCLAALYRLTDTAAEKIQKSKEPQAG